MAENIVFAGSTPSPGVLCSELCIEKPPLERARTAHIEAIVFFINLNRSSHLFLTEGTLSNPFQSNGFIFCKFLSINYL
jgi:hypothetical protein